MSQNNIDEKILELHENYKKVMGIDKNYRNNVLSSEFGKKTKIYESEELKQKEKGIAFKVKSFASKGSTSTSKSISKVFSITSLLIGLVVHLLVSLVAVFAIYVTLQALVFPIIPVSFVMPVTILSFIFAFVVVFKS